METGQVITVPSQKHGGPYQVRVVIANTLLPSPSRMQIHKHTHMPSHHAVFLLEKNNCNKADY